MYENVITSILTGIVASFSVFLLFFVWRPSIVVSDSLAYDKSNDKLNVKIINKTKVPVHDVTYEMLKCYNRGDGIVDIVSCKPAKPNMFVSYSAAIAKDKGFNRDRCHNK